MEEATDETRMDHRLEGTFGKVGQVFRAVEGVLRSVFVFGAATVGGTRKTVLENRPTRGHTARRTGLQARFFFANAFQGNAKDGPG